MKPQRKIFTPTRIKKVIQKKKISMTAAPIIAVISGLFGYYGALDHSVKGPVQVRMCFTPGEPCLPLIIGTLRKAKRTIDVQAYTMTSRSIAQELIFAKKRGVKIRILFDKSQRINPYGQFQILKKNHLNIRIDYRPAIAHNKVMIIDHRYTLTGSYNWTEGAERRNAENLLIIDNKSIARKYENNFEKRWILSADDYKKKGVLSFFKRKKA
jgi:phospholipase D